MSLRTKDDKSEMSPEELLSEKDNEDYTSDEDSDQIESDNDTSDERGRLHDEYKYVGQGLVPPLPPNKFKQLQNLK